MERLLPWLTVSDFIAIGTLIATVATFVGTVAISVLLLRIERARRREEIARATQANIQVELRRPTAPDPAHALVLTNTGGAVAQNVNVDAFTSTLVNSPFPIDAIYPGDSAEGVVLVT
jgi:hypothetical protein